MSKAVLILRNQSDDLGENGSKQDTGRTRHTAACISGQKLAPHQQDCLLPLGEGGKVNLLFFASLTSK